MGGGTGERVPVIVNVYDLAPGNKYTYGCGLGIFHSGVEVYGVEYAFGGETSAAQTPAPCTSPLCPADQSVAELLAGGWPRGRAGWLAGWLKKKPHVSFLDRGVSTVPARAPRPSPCVLLDPSHSALPSSLLSSSARLTYIPSKGMGWLGLDSVILATN